MMTRVGLAISLLAAGLVGVIAPKSPAYAQAEEKVFEIRTYTATEGNLAALQTLFRDHAARLMEKHGIRTIAYWIPQDSPLSGTTFISVVVHPNRVAASANWAAFQADPEWTRARVEAETLAKGRLAGKVDSIFATAADFSPMK